MYHSEKKSAHVSIQQEPIVAPSGGQALTFGEPLTPTPGGHLVLTSTWSTSSRYHWGVRTMTNGEGAERQAPSGENNGGGAADPATQAVARARVSRRQRKAAVTRLLGSIDASVVENNTGAVKQKLEQIKVTFSNLEAAHDAYHAMLVDDDDIAESEEWFISAQRNYVQSVKSFNQWLESRSNVNPPMSDSGANSDIHDDMCKMMSMMSLPSVQIDKYSGDPLHYQAFICIFDEVVASKDIDDQIRLTRLLQYTEGEAKNAIKNCALVGGSAGYKQARDILSSRFGDPHIISQSIMRDLKSGKSISKNSDLQQLADELTMARTALKKLGMTSEIDNQKSILEILQRCPRYIMNKWRIKALEHKRDKDKYPGFDDFVDFISLKALDACDPAMVRNLSGSSRRNIKGPVSLALLVTSRVTSAEVAGNLLARHVMMMVMLNRPVLLVWCVQEVTDCFNATISKPCLPGIV